MNNKWSATHRIWKDGCVYHVMLDDGPAYTEDEWNTDSQADFERTEDGSWLFQGQSFRGKVTSLKEEWTRLMRI